MDIICWIRIPTAKCPVTMNNWAYEDIADPIDPEERARFASATEAEVIALYWAMRKVVRRFRIAKGKGGPRTRYTGGKARKRFRRFPARSGRGRNGVLCRRTFCLA